MYNMNFALKRHNHHDVPCMWTKTNFFVIFVNDMTRFMDKSLNCYLQNRNHAVVSLIRCTYDCTVHNTRL